MSQELKNLWFLPSHPSRAYTDKPIPNHSTGLDVLGEGIECAQGCLAQLGNVGGDFTEEVTFNL